jgi:alpha-tubulin suppressor-like RCC1 family protein
MQLSRRRLTSSVNSAVVAGASHTCLLNANGSVMCWGQGNSGKLGYGSTAAIGKTNATLPYTAGYVNTGTSFIQIAVGGSHTCGLTGNGSVMCWGSGTGGVLGYGSTSNVADTCSSLPYTKGFVNTGTAFVQIVVGGSHTCGLTANGSVMCWGSSSSGQLGYGNKNNVGDKNTTLPYTAGFVNTGTAFVQIASGSSHTCGLAGNGSVMCWGAGAFGKLGYGNADNVGTTNTTLPYMQGFVDTRTSFAKIFAFADGTCGLTGNGSVMCWGYGLDGELGYGVATSVGDTATTLPYTQGFVKSGTAFVQIAIGFAHTCGLVANGSVMCWGQAMYGQLGYGSTINVGNTATTKPYTAGFVQTGASFIWLTAGQSHTCGLTTNGSVVCWGQATYGQPGYGSTTNVGGTSTTLPYKQGFVNITGPDSSVPIATAAPACSPTPSPTPSASVTASYTASSLPTPVAGLETTSPTASETPSFSDTSSDAASDLASESDSTSITISQTPIVIASASASALETANSSASKTQTPSFTASESLSNTASETSTSTESGTGSYTESETSSFTVSETSSSTASQTQTPSFTASESLSNTASETSTSTESGTGSYTESETSSFTVSETTSPTASQTQTPSFTASESLSNTASETSTSTKSGTGSYTESETSSFTVSETSSSTASQTQTPSFTASESLSNTASETSTSTESGTGSYTESETSSFTVSETSSSTASQTQTPSFTASESLSNTASETSTSTESGTGSYTESETSSFTVSETSSSTASQTQTPSFSQTTAAMVTSTESPFATVTSSFSASKSKSPVTTKSPIAKKFSITAAVQFLNSNTTCSQQVLIAAQGGLTAAVNKLTKGTHAVDANCYNELLKFTTRRLQSGSVVLDPQYLTVFFTLSSENNEEILAAADTMASLISNRTILEHAIQGFDIYHAFGLKVVIVGGTDPVITSADQSGASTTGVLHFAAVGNCIFL